MSENEGQGVDASPDEDRTGTHDESSTGDVTSTENGAASDEESATSEESPPEGSSDGEADSTGEGSLEEVDPELRERVADADPAELARSIEGLRERIEAAEARAEDAEARVAELEAERDELESKLKRKQADFQNYKKRQERRREEVRQRATEDLVERLLETRDNLVRALDQDAGTDIRDGVEVTLHGFDEVLEGEDVASIEPEPGDDTDPQRHEVLMRVESDRPEGTVVDLHRPGYVMAGKVLRPAQVTVSKGPSDDEMNGAADEDPGASTKDEADEET